MFGPECFKFVVSIDFDNSDYDGQMPVILEHHPHRMECTGMTKTVEYRLPHLKCTKKLLLLRYYVCTVM